MDSKDAITTVLELPEHERIALVQQLLSGLPPEKIPPLYESAWEEEALARSRAIKSGTVNAVDGKEVMRELREQL